MSQRSKAALEIKKLLEAAAKYEKTISNSKPKSRKRAGAIKSRNSCMRKILKLMVKLISGNRKLSLVISDRLLIRIIGVLGMATQVFENPESAIAWMNKPQFSLSWQKPIDLIKTKAGEELVKNLLGAIENGGVL